MYKNISNYMFLYFFLPSLVVGVFVSNLVYALFTTTYLLLNFKQLKKYFLKYIKFSIFFSCFYFYLLVSSLSSEEIKNSLESSLLYFSLLIYVFAIIDFFSQDNKRIIIFLKIATLTFFIISIDALIEFIFGNNTLGFSSDLEGRIAGLFNNRLVIGKYLILLLPTIVGIFFLNFNLLSKGFKNFFYLVLVFSFFTILISGERAAYLLLILYFFLLIMYFFKKISPKKLIVIFVSILLFLAIPFTFSEKKSRLFFNIDTYFEISNYDENPYAAMFKTAINIHVQDFLIGAGPNNYRTLCNKEKFKTSNLSCSTHPHNIPIQLLAEIGIFGFVFVYFVFLYFIYQIKYEIVESKLHKSSLGLYSIKSSFILYLWPFIISGNFFLSWYSFIFYLAFSMYLLFENRINN